MGRVAHEATTTLKGLTQHKAAPGRQLLLYSVAGDTVGQAVAPKDPIRVAMEVDETSAAPTQSTNLSIYYFGQFPSR